MPTACIKELVSALNYVTHTHVLFSPLNLNNPDRMHFITFIFVSTRILHYLPRIFSITILKLTATIILITTLLSVRKLFQLLTLQFLRRANIHKMFHN